MLPAAAAAVAAFVCCCWIHVGAAAGAATAAVDAAAVAWAPRQAGLGRQPAAMLGSNHIEQSGGRGVTLPKC